MKNNDFFKTALCAPLLLATLVAGTGAAYAQKDEEDSALSLTTRMNPAYDPVGYKLGDFTLFSGISNTLQYQDNIYATKEDERSDYVYSVQPNFSLRSNFVRHSLSAGAFYDEGWYRDLDSENYKDYGANLGGSLDITGQTSLPVSLSFQREHIRRGSPDDERLSEPTFYKVVNATMSLIHRGQTLAAKIITGFKRYVYENVSGATADLDMGDADRNEYSVYSSIGFNDDAVFSPFVYTRALQVGYDRAVDNEGFDKDAFEYEGGVGTILNISRLTRASFTVGKVHRTIDDPAFDDIDGYAYGVNVTWEPSTLMSFLLEGQRAIRESTSNGNSSRIDTSLQLSANYEMFPNLFIQPSVGVSEQDYQGGQGGKTQSTNGGISMTYKMNRNLWLSSSYRFNNQEEKEAAPGIQSYDSNTYSLSLRLQF
ncbi:MAG: hypothetical protein DI551_06845 [Micavibrio aeruginosavorus]|uniref:Outer membrane beta-barrel protein n=1 Tax=Micavibrio aeruginosavorus TaxID=349221 RepID=A0A2W5Q2Q3_9BACT|nr:MAG: hypothetical protein DI551_06845 [Micavibrio aeruginosavorus]